jgi:peptidoglycan/xylan/chitin deacetylase (PgdA/CDA1 family)
MTAEQSLEQPAGFETLRFPAVPPNPARTVKVPVLMFHHVGDIPAGADRIRRNLTVSRHSFEAQMSYLKQAGYHPISQSQLFKALFYGDALPANSLMLTFDDGYADNYFVALPILKKYGFTATFYIITGLVGSSEYMNWDQVTELESSGMDVGSHTLSHKDLTTLSVADLNHELKDSAQDLSTHLGHPIYWFCYPAGKYNDDVIKTLRESGYLLAVTAKPGEKQSSDAPFEVLRYWIRSDTGLEEFKELVR